MLAYRQHITIEDPQHVDLSNLPLKAGQRAEVLILIIEEEIATEKTAIPSKLRLPLTSREEVFAKQTLANTSRLEHLRAIRDEE
ncbi:MAG TPA: hypothetical protein ENF37_00535 [Beggiatoa sp.]|nr:MAG: hypothetical protein B6247_20745 [Beggiatoa sp. 4572_84]RKZ54469.1 MAG: hypothetical protein DRR08_26430 [Gammaproteobacteria bacterium]HEW97120.1 hypothetical protein [Beggiatoa sp.]